MILLIKGNTYCKLMRQKNQAQIKKDKIIKNG